MASNNAGSTSIRGNSVPSGGATDTVSTVNPQTGQPLTPDQATCLSVSKQISKGGPPNVTLLNPMALSAGLDTSQQIRQTGLGESIDLPFSKQSLSFVNTSASPVTLFLSPEFPFSLIAKIGVQFNGQTNIIQMSGYEALAMMAKRSRSGLFVKPAGTARYNPFQARLSSTRASLTAGANVTLNAGDGLTGYTSITIAGSSTGVLYFDMNLRINFTMRKDLLIGLLPLQNNSVNAQLTLTCPTLVGTTPASPLWISVIPSTLTASISAVCSPEYNFFANNAQIASYTKYMSAFSYQQITVPQQICQSTGSEALQYTLPNNYLLVSMLATIRDGNGVLLNVNDPAYGINFPYINYNNTNLVDRRSIASRLAVQSDYYGAVPYGPGQVLYDGSSIAHSPNGMDDASWLNMYYANNPQYRMDVQASVVTPLSYSMLREQIVPAQVTVIS